jgi:hypothetical protein
MRSEKSNQVCGGSRRKPVTGDPVAIRSEA